MLVLKRKRNLYDRKYKYKIYTNCKVIWTPYKEKWLDKKDFEWIKEMDFHLRNKFKKNEEYKIQGSVIYCKNIDVAFYARIICGDRITKIEECIYE